MRRTAALVVFALVAGLGWQTVVDGQIPLSKEEKAVPDKALSATDVVAALSQRADIPSMDDPRTTITDALQLLSKRYHVTFDINEKAFRAKGITEFAPLELNSLPIPAGKNVRLDVALKRVLRRVPVESATFLVRDDCIEITTTDFAKAEVWGEEFEGPFLPLVHLRAEKVPLTEALTQLAEQGGHNIVYSGGTDKTAVPVSARMYNVPLDTAVRMLAHQAGLTVVHRDNVILVTTEDKAEALANRFHDENPEAGIKWRRGSGQSLGIGTPCGKVTGARHYPLIAVA